MSEQFLEGLNDVQRAAVLNNRGASLVIAGAGSGKTRVLTFKIAYMISQGMKPNRILALTFTNKAAKEMKERIAGIIGQNAARSLWMGTFHSIFSRILRLEAQALGYSQNFTIYDTSDTKSLLKTLLDELRLDDKIYKPNVVYGKISAAKNNLITPEAYKINGQMLRKDAEDRVPRISEIYELYAQRCRKADAMDFDDLLLYTNILFRDHPEILEKYQNMYDYIMVDEYQDTNYSQYLIVKKLAANHQNVCVVGDDAQSIYSFRGAKIENILSFQSDYKDCKVYKLEQNYRSSQVIVNAANSVIAKNKRQLQKNSFSSNLAGDLIKLFNTKDDKEEGYTIANQIKQHVANGGQFNDHAVLYRTNAQSRVFEDVFRHLSIPYKIYGSLSFYQRKEIKDLLGYFRIIVNYKDEEAFKRIINYPARGIGKTTLDKIETLAVQHNISSWDLICDYKKFALDINAGTANKINSFIELINSFKADINTVDAFTMAERIAKQSGIYFDLNEKGNFEKMSKFENLEEMINSIRDFVDNHSTDFQKATLPMYLENVALLTGDENEDPDEFNKVSLMTIHSSKGLEYSNVYIVGLEEELFPSSMSLENIEEERRLFYVAITRAKEAVTLSYANSRFKWGNITFTKPSRFLNDIDPSYMETSDNSLYTNKSSSMQTLIAGVTQHQRSNIALRTPQPPKSGEIFNFDDPSLIRSGMNVEHERFGVGKVLVLEGDMPNSKATVFFQNEGQKTLLLKYAKLKIVEIN